MAAGRHRVVVLQHQGLGGAEHGWDVTFLLTVQTDLVQGAGLMAD